MKFNFKKEDIKLLLSTRRYLLFAGLMVVISIAIAFFGVINQISGIVELVGAGSEARETTKMLQVKANSLKEVDYLAEFSKSPQVDLALPSEKPLLQLITGVNNVAQQVGVSLSDVTTSPGKLASQSAVLNLDGTPVPVTTSVNQADDSKLTINGVNLLTIGLKAHGSLTQINNFLDSIEKITPITQATKLKLTLLQEAQSPVATLSATPSGDSYEAQLELTTYYFSQPISVTVDTPLPSIGTKEEAFLNSLDSFQFPDYQKQQQIQGGGSTDLFGAQ